MVSTFDPQTAQRLATDLRRTDSVGEIVLWSIPDRCEISVTLMEAAFSQSFWPTGMLEDGTPEPDLSMFCPKQPSFELAMSRAVRDGRRRKLVAKSEDATNATFGVVAAHVERVGSEVVIEARKEMQAEIDKVAGKVTSADYAVEQELQGKVDHNRFTFTGRDLSMVLITLVEHAQGIRLRPSGGDYFVPRTHLGVARKMEKIVALTTANRGYVSAFSVGGSPRERDNLSRHAHEALMADIAQISQEVDALSARVTAGETVRPNTIVERIKRAKALREKAALYEDLASARVETVKASISELEEHCNMLLGF